MEDQGNIDGPLTEEGEDHFDVGRSADDLIQRKSECSPLSSLGFEPAQGRINNPQKSGPKSPDT